MDDAEPTHPEDGQPAGRILIVDDVPDNRTLLARYFGRRGFDTVTAENGRQALLLVAEQPFDAVLLDIVMPDMDGLEVLAQIRTRWSPTALPVIMVTALSEAGDVVRALSQGANDYLTKPVDFEVAHARVASQIERRRDQQELEHLVAGHSEARELIEAALKRRLDQLKKDSAALGKTNLDARQKALLQSVQSCAAEIVKAASGALELTGAARGRPAN